MRIRRLPALLLATLLVGSLAATTSPGATADDPCGDPFDSDAGAAAVPWQDLCSLEVAQVLRADDDAPTALRVQLRAASAERTTPTIYTVRWDVDGCAHRLVHGDALPDRPEVSQFSVDCDGPDGPFDDCVAEVLDHGVICFTGRPAVDIPPPTVVDGSVTWELEFTDEIAELAGSYPAGTELELRASTSSARVTSQRAFPPDIACAGTFCAGAGSDLLDATGQALVIR